MQEQTEFNTEIKKKAYLMGEVSEIISMPAATIRDYTERFNIVTQRRGSNKRVFNNNDITKLKYVKFLVNRKMFTLAGAEQQVVITGWPPESVLEEWTRDHDISLYVFKAKTKSWGHTRATL